MYSIDYIKIKNFRQYYDIELELPNSTKDKNITVIVGANGAGKTNLLNALTWCLYGQELHLGTKYKGLPQVNTTYWDSIPDGKIGKMEVEISFKGNNDSIIFKREKLFKKEKGNKEPIVFRDPNISSRDGSNFIVKQKMHNESEWNIHDYFSSENPEHHVTRHMPENIENFFFFDGERLDDYFLSTTADSIKKSVYKVSHLDLFKKMLDRLGKREKVYFDDSNDLSPRGEELKGDKKQIESELETLGSELDTLQEERQEAEIEISFYRDKIVQYGGKSIEDLDDERESLKNENKELQISLDNRNQDKIDILFKYSFLIYGYESITETIDKISQRKEAGLLPPSVGRIFLNKILENDVCICTQPLEKGSKYRVSIEELLRVTDELTDVSEDLIYMLASLSNEVLKIDDFFSERDTINEIIQLHEEKYKTNSVRVSEIDLIIGTSGVGALKHNEQKFQEWDAIKDRVVEKIGAKKADIDNKKLELERKKTELTKEIVKEEKNEELVKLITFCNSSIQVGTEIINNVMKNVRNEIESLTNEQFKQLLWKKVTYDKVTIADDYLVSVTHASGFEGIGTLSAGERQVLALAFMAALNQVSGFELPIIIDTPLGRISSKPKKNIANALPNYLPNRQITILMTDEEFTEPVREGLEKRIDKIYELNFTESPSGGKTEVKMFG